jgi:hypothetical protein
MWDLSKKQKQEIESLQKNGIVYPADIIEFAKDPETALHNRFDWDDTEAAQKWRLVQARNIIRVYVKVHKSTHITTRAFVSLSTDRKNGGGYTAMAQVLSREDKHKQMLADALAELVIVRQKYAQLKELVDVFRAIDHAVALRPKSRGAKENGIQPSF